MDGRSSPASHARTRSDFTPIFFAMASRLRLAASLAQTSNFGFAKPSTCAIVGQRVTVIYTIVKTTAVTGTRITNVILMPAHRRRKHPEVCCFRQVDQSGRNGSQRLKPWPDTDHFYAALKHRLHVRRDAPLRAFPSPPGADSVTLGLRRRLHSFAASRLATH